MPHGHRVGTNKIRTYPPIATVYVEIFFCSNVCVVLVRQFVHLANHFFSATQFQHGLSEPCITNETDRECSRIVVSYTSFGVDSQCDILDHLPSFRIGDRVVDLS